MSRKSVIRGLPALDLARVHALGADLKESGLRGRDCSYHGCWKNICAGSIKYDNVDPRALLFCA